MDWILGTRLNSSGRLSPLLGWGGRKVNGSDGWSARGLFETRNGADSTAIGFYCYHADMRGRYGEN